ncbi:MAG: M12 family metallo-peptidase [Flavobacterium sp.]|nr:M12 family metallo-peptidase [Flavobacterium sp.]
MKKILLFLLVCTATFGQNSRKVAHTIGNLQKANKTFVPYSIFNVNENFANSSYKNVVSNATIAILDLNKVNQIVAEKNNTIALEIPYLNATISVLLYKVDIQTQDYQVDTDKQKNLQLEQGVFYRGIIKNDPNSLVSFNFFHNQMNGIISANALQNLVIGKLNTPNNAVDYIIYSDRDIINKKNYKCDTSGALPKLPQPTISTNRNATLTQKCVTIYFEIEYDIYVANGNDINQTNIWMNSVFNNVQTLFANNEINTAIKSVFIWTEPDPYVGNSSLENLYLFMDYRPVFNGDVGDVVGFDNYFGGIASTGGLCAEYNQAYTDVFFDFQSVPAFSLTVEVITHELGHLMGSPHTHDCFWNGDATPIDGCGPSQGYDGLSFTGEPCIQSEILPAPETGGTIMSYCHLVDGVGINFANGFGPQPTAYIQAFVDNSSCLSSDCINTCISQIYNATIIPSTITNTSATVSWQDGDSSNTIWEVGLSVYPFDNPTWTTTAINPYTITGLTPDTYYSICVRPICPAGLNTTSNCIILTTAGGDFCAGAAFTDTGGATGDYTANENIFKVVAPDNPDDKVKVVFTSFDTEPSYDFLYVYDGDTLLTLEGLSGNTIPGPYTATDSSGALKFKFTSDGYVNAAGWTGNFSCENLGVTNHGIIDFTYYPNPVKDVIMIQSKTEISNIAIYSIDGKLLYNSNAKVLETKIDMSAYASGTYIFKLQFENQSANFKVTK